MDILYLTYAVVDAAVLWYCSTSVDNSFRHIIIRYKQQRNKILAEIKRNSIMEAKLSVYTQSLDRSYLPSNVVAAAMFWYCCYFCRWL